MIRLRAFVENNLYIVAGIALGAAVAQLLGTFLFNHDRVWKQEWKCNINSMMGKYKSSINIFTFQSFGSQESWKDKLKIKNPFGYHTDDI